MAAFGRLDMAFNNAVIMIPPSEAADEPTDNFDQVNAINLRGVWACMKHELRQMREQGSGAIVNCSSLGGLVGLPGRASYHASKHGVIGLTKSTPSNTRHAASASTPSATGTIDTPMVADMLAKGELEMTDAIRNQPIGRLGTADEIATAVLRLCSPASSFSSESHYPSTAATPPPDRARAIFVRVEGISGFRIAATPGDTDATVLLGDGLSRCSDRNPRTAQPWAWTTSLGPPPRSRHCRFSRPAE